MSKTILREILMGNKSLAKSMSKTAFILTMPKATAAEVVKAGASKGMPFTVKYVYGIRSKHKKAEPQKDASKKIGRPAGSKNKNKVQTKKAFAISSGADTAFLLATLAVGLDRAESILASVRKAGA